jgi:SMC interacting uncharacterized protein involved in chromosome segregation
MIRKAYLKKIEAALEDWGDEITKLKVKAEKAEKEVKGIYKEQLEGLRSKQEVALERFRELRGAGANDWGKFKSGVEESVRDLKKAVEKAVEKLRKIA